MPKSLTERGSSSSAYVPVELIQTGWITVVINYPDVHRDPHKEYL